LEPVKATMRCLEDSVGLEEIGSTMAFPSDMLSKLNEKDPIVLYEDARARVYNTYILNLTQEISGSMSWWTSHYPGKMAAALSETTAYESPQALKKTCEAWWYCKDTPAGPRHMHSSWEHSAMSMLRLCVRMHGGVSTLAAGGDCDLHLLLYCFLSLVPPCVQTFSNSARIWVTASGG